MPRILPKSLGLKTRSNEEKSGSNTDIHGKRKGWGLMTHNYRGSIIVLSISKSVEPNEEQKEMINDFQQSILCKY